MHKTHSCVIPTLNFGLWNFGKKHISYITRTDFLEFLAAKFNLNLTLGKISGPFFSFGKKKMSHKARVESRLDINWLISIKDQNLYSLNRLKRKIYTVSGAKAQTCSHKKCSKLVAKISSHLKKKQFIKSRHIPVAISLSRRKTKVFVTI